MQIWEPFCFFFSFWISVIYLLAFECFDTPACLVHSFFLQLLPSLLLLSYWVILLWIWYLCKIFWHLQGATLSLSLCLLDFLFLFFASCSNFRFVSSETMTFSKGLEKILSSSCWSRYTSASLDLGSFEWGTLLSSCTLSCVFMSRMGFRSKFSCTEINVSSLSGVELPEFDILQKLKAEQMNLSAQKWPPMWHSDITNF